MTGEHLRHSLYASTGDAIALLVAGRRWTRPSRRLAVRSVVARLLDIRHSLHAYTWRDLERDADTIRTVVAVAVRIAPTAGDA